MFVVDKIHTRMNAYLDLEKMIMAVMTLKRVPTEEELENECNGMEAVSFLEDFRKKSVGPFSAEVTVKNGTAYLDGFGWEIKPSDWYEIK